MRRFTRFLVALLSFVVVMAPIPFASADPSTHYPETLGVGLDIGSQQHPGFGFFGSSAAPNVCPGQTVQAHIGLSQAQSPGHIGMAYVAIMQNTKFLSLVYLPSASNADYRGDITSLFTGLKPGTYSLRFKYLGVSWTNIETAEGGGSYKDVKSYAAADLMTNVTLSCQIKVALRLTSGVGGNVRTGESLSADRNSAGWSAFGNNGDPNSRNDHCVSSCMDFEVQVTDGNSNPISDATVAVSYQMLTSALLTVSQTSTFAQIQEVYPTSSFGPLDSSSYMGGIHTDGSGIADFRIWLPGVKPTLDVKPGGGGSMLQFKSGTRTYQLTAKASRPLSKDATATQNLTESANQIGNLSATLTDTDVTALDWASWVADKLNSVVTSPVMAFLDVCSAMQSWANSMNGGTSFGGNLVSLGTGSFAAVCNTIAQAIVSASTTNMFGDLFNKYIINQKWNVNPWDAIGKVCSPLHFVGALRCGQFVSRLQGLTKAIAPWVSALQNVLKGATAVAYYVTDYLFNSKLGIWSLNGSGLGISSPLPNGVFEAFGDLVTWSVSLNITDYDNAVVTLLRQAVKNHHLDHGSTIQALFCETSRYRDGSQENGDIGGWVVLSVNGKDVVQQEMRAQGWVTAYRPSLLLPALSTAAAH
jgi:hypothetical protein